MRVFAIVASLAATLTSVLQISCMTALLPMIRGKRDEVFVESES